MVFHTIDMPTLRSIEVEIRHTGNITRLIDKMQDFSDIFKVRKVDLITEVRRDKIIIDYDGFQSDPATIISKIRSIDSIYSIKVPENKTTKRVFN